MNRRELFSSLSAGVVALALSTRLSFLPTIPQRKDGYLMKSTPWLVTWGKDGITGIYPAEKNERTNLSN